MVVHDGDLVLDGSDIFVIDCRFFIQKGNIYVTENATLKLIDSKLQLGEEDDDEWYRFEVSGSGYFMAENSIIWSEEGVRIKLLDSSRAEIRSTELTNPYQRNNITYYSSGFQQFDKASIKCYDSEVGFIGVHDNAFCHVADSFIGWFNPHSTAHSVIVNSTVERLRLYFEDGAVSFTEPVKGFHTYWNPKTDLNTDVCLSDFEAFNTTIVNHPWFLFDNCTINIFNSQLNVVYSENCSSISIKNSDIWVVDLTGSSEDTTFQNSSIDYVNCYLGNFTLEMQDSTFKRIFIDSEGSLRLIIQNCSINQMEIYDWEPDVSEKIVFEKSLIGNLTLGMGMKGPLQYQFKDTVIEEKLFLGHGAWEEEGGLIIKGGLKFGENATFGISYRSGYHRIKRQYDVWVHRGVEPLTNIRLELRRGNETVWTGESDADGRSSFNLTFVDVFQLVRPYVPGGPSVINLKNMTDTLTLIASDRREDVEAEIGLLSDTPIELIFEVSEYSPIFWIPIAAGIIGTLLILYTVRRASR